MPKPGSVVRIPLNDGRQGYARTLTHSLMEFFDYSEPVTESPDLPTVLSAPVVFVIPVMNDTVRTGRWPVVGHVPLSDSESTHTERFFKQDIINGKLTIYWENPDNTWEEIPATFDQIQGLERAAVWSDVHVEDRLRDHFAGVPNKWAKSLLPKQ